MTVATFGRNAQLWPARARRAIARLGAVPTTIRVLAAVMAMASVVAAVPSIFTGFPAGAGVASGLGAVAVGVFPRTRWVSMFLVLVIGLWVLDTIGVDGGVSPFRAGLLATTVYLTHSAAALAAVLPYDCVVTFRVLRAWLGRALTVVVAGVGIGMVGMAAIAYLPTARSVVGPIVGSVIAAGLAGLLAWHVRRR